MLVHFGRAEATWAFVVTPWIVLVKAVKWAQTSVTIIVVKQMPSCPNVLASALEDMGGQAFGFYHQTL